MFILLRMLGLYIKRKPPTGVGQYFVAVFLFELYGTAY